MIKSTKSEKFKNNNYGPRFRDPIGSYGLLPFHIEKSNEELTKPNIKFLIQQRRDTFEYITFIQGLWDTLERVKYLFSLMSHEERDRILNYTLQELWDDMWINKSSTMYRDCFAKAKRKYDFAYDHLVHIINTTSTTVIDPPWGFPKGRKNDNKEKDITCAIRESEEETRISASNYKIFNNRKFSERFKGSNGIFYSTLYFLCEIKSGCLLPSPILTPNGIRKESISEEVNDMKWLSYEEASKFLNPQRQLMLLEVLKTIEKMK